eukprot:CAMPEP_0117743612 /NCGR_PEP_ID=MMETSP0947-20121206/6249_1 /TAXON_ID=44440 /ORGANISM="Chattonella subsalsa, Strain CCMP2191" /LENGTH=256 /DNA_ID=CAMNT_0005560367 /DNA_START=148 /DNA_END=918 /DNA_ORIENTATION=+
MEQSAQNETKEGNPAEEVKITEYEAELHDKLMARLRRCANSHKRDNLNLSNLELNVLPENEISAFPLLQVLNIRGNGLTAFPADLCPIYAQLTELDLSRNRLNSLPENFSDMGALMSLHLDFNEFESLPDCLFGLYQLEALSVQNNRLVVLSANIGNLYALKHLNLFGNNIRIIPDEAEDLENLQSLDITGNPVTHMPPRFEQLQYQKQICRSKEERQKLIKRALNTQKAVLNAYQKELLANDGATAQGNDGLSYS